MSWYREFIPSAPRDVYAWLGIHTALPGRPSPRSCTSERRHTAARATTWSALERPVEEVLEDLADGYISVAQAERDYGVLVDHETGKFLSVSDDRRAREQAADDAPASGAGVRLAR
jgi:hypothetical protein